MSLLTRISRRLFGIAREEAHFSSRGFSSAEACEQQRLEACGSSFIDGYNLGLANPQAHSLALELNQRIDAELRGFAFEGAAMGLALVDWMTFCPLRRWRQMAAGPGAAHIYMLHVGAGWAAARVPWARLTIERRLAQFDPLMRWLIIDGYGFHEGYFAHKRFIEKCQLPKRLSPIARRVFDQGLGRSLWFVAGANVDHVDRRIGAFVAPRRGDLWSGVGLACAYAGGTKESAIERLSEHAGQYAGHLAQGAAFAAKARLLANNLAPHTEMACRVLCGTSAEEAAAVTDECLRDLPPDGDTSAYEIWRTRIRAHFQAAHAQADRAAQVT